ncbi:MAG: hypothetical protein M1818_001676 [Claussenomyces sp. TS43310]|nr:MAG: hypothetical protein M1818_001676 [Claussenomyces sp. TS43310]
MAGLPFRHPMFSSLPVLQPGAMNAEGDGEARHYELRIEGQTGALTTFTASYPPNTNQAQRHPGDRPRLSASYQLPPPSFNHNSEGQHFPAPFTAPPWSGMPQTFSQAYISQPMHQFNSIQVDFQGGYGQPIGPVPHYVDPRHPFHGTPQAVSSNAARVTTFWPSPADPFNRIEQIPRQHAAIELMPGLAVSAPTAAQLSDGYCPICLNITSPPNQAVTKPCNHSFCYDCINEGIMHHLREGNDAICPLCRGIIREVWHHFIDGQNEVYKVEPLPVSPWNTPAELAERAANPPRTEFSPAFPRAVRLPNLPGYVVAAPVWSIPPQPMPPLPPAAIPGDMQGPRARTSRSSRRRRRSLRFP